MLMPGSESFSRHWSNITQWPNQVLPQTGDNVTIPLAWNLILDVDPPELYYVEINGNFIFDRARNNTFKAHIIWVRTGRIWIGSADRAFSNMATIVLLGN